LTHISMLPVEYDPSQAQIDELWAAEAERRTAEVETSNLKLIPGEQVFEELWKRLGLSTAP
jgi:hypothetical protein